MAIETASFNMTIDKTTKDDLERLYQGFGLTLSQAVNLFFSQSLAIGGLPFAVSHRKYNRETEEAMQEARDIASGKIQAKSYHSARELFDELDAE